MKALDTNVLIRFLVRDDATQAKAVYKIFKNAEAEKTALFLPLLVVLETIWVLESVYAVTRQELLGSFESLLLMPTLKFEAQPAVRRFIVSARKSKIDLSDLLIAASAQSTGCDAVLTFDKAASKSQLFELIA